MALVSSAARARRRPRASWTRTAFAVGAAVVAVTVAACGNGSSSAASGGGTTDGFKAAAQTSGPLTVWVDSTRVPAVQAYEKAHPNVKIDMVTYDGDANGDGTMQTKTALFNRVGHGWPDVIFSEQNIDIDRGWNVCLEARQHVLDPVDNVDDVGAGLLEDI